MLYIDEHNYFCSVVETEKHKQKMQCTVEGLKGDHDLKK